MPVPVFEQTIQKVKETKRVEPEHVSGSVAFFAIILILLIAVTMEIALLDINRIFNPQYDSCRARGPIVQRLFDTDSVPKTCDLKQYESARLLLHADVVVPLVLVCVLGFVLININKRSVTGKIFRVVFVIVAAWGTVRVTYEGLAYSLRHHALYGKYFVLLTAAIAIIVMIMWLQRNMVDHRGVAPVKK
ncbi:MAG: hypothetical protein HZC01_04860 [Candidatus Kerfeldbacteria bacterium]|nr:hypothetical protein [Candidatus Kerfeldbacteria bacterium]